MYESKIVKMASQINEDKVKLEKEDRKDKGSTLSLSLSRNPNVSPHQLPFLHVKASNPLVTITTVSPVHSLQFRVRVREREL